MFGTRPMQLHGASSTFEEKRNIAVNLIKKMYLQHLAGAFSLPEWEELVTPSRGERNLKLLASVLPFPNSNTGTWRSGDIMTQTMVHPHCHRPEEDIL